MRVEEIIYYTVPTKIRAWAVRQAIITKETHNLWAGEVVWKLKVPVAVAESLDLVPRIYTESMVTHNYP